jgi:hypothetical protein
MLFISRRSRTQRPDRRFRPELGRLEDRITPAAAYLLAVGAGAGGLPAVRMLTAVGAVQREFLAYDAGFFGGVRVGTGDVNRDGVPDIVTGAGPDGGPHVKVFDGATGAPLASFFAYDAAFAGGVYVAAGDVNGDGFADVITGAGAGGGPHVKVVDGAALLAGSLSDLRSFMAYNVGFPGGVSVAAADFNGDGRAEVVTGAGPGGGPHVEVFNGGDGGVVGSFFAFGPDFPLGILVAAGPVGDLGVAIVVVGDSMDSVAIFNFQGGTVGGFTPYPVFSHSQIPLTVAVGDATGDGLGDVILGRGPDGGTHVWIFDGTDRSPPPPIDALGLHPVFSFDAFDPAFPGGVFVA